MAGQNRIGSSGGYGLQKITYLVPQPVPVPTVLVWYQTTTRWNQKQHRQTAKVSKEVVLCTSKYAMFLRTVTCINKVVGFKSRPCLQQTKFADSPVQSTVCGLPAMESLPLPEAMLRHTRESEKIVICTSNLCYVF